MTERVFERESKVGRDGKVRLSTVIFDNHLTEPGRPADVQVSLSCCINSVQPSFTFYESDELRLFELAEQFRAVGMALVYAKKYEAKGGE